MKVELFSERMPDEEPYLLLITIDSIKGDSQATVPLTAVSAISSSTSFPAGRDCSAPGTSLECSGWKVPAAPVRSTTARRC